MSTDYRDLIAWQRAMNLIVTVYGVTRSFPADERFGLTNQLRRAVVSIASNIAEGQGRQSVKDFVRFLRIANGSRQEVETQLFAANELGFASDDELSTAFSQSEEVGRLVAGLIRSLLTRN